MKKVKYIALAVVMTVFTLFPYEAIGAVDFSSDEQGWLNRCRVPQSSQADVELCRQFRAYYEKKQAALTDDLNAMRDRVNELKNDISKASSYSKELKEKMAYYDGLIATNNESIAVIQKEINRLSTAIEEKQKNIDARYDLIKQRMLDEQATLGTNMELEIIMGANDLVDMLRKIDGLAKITESDKKEIEIIKEEQAKLKLDKSEQDRLKEEAETVKRENEQNRRNIEVLKEAQDAAIAYYQQQEADLAAQMRSTQADISAIGNNIIHIDVSDVVIGGNTGFISPVAGGYVSAGTWFYPGGGAHLGMDISTAIGTPLRAPADGIVLYAANPVGSNSGYLGNWSGYPAGGGNTIHFLTQVNGITYAMSFFHLSQNGFAVSAGSQVSAGQMMALTGNSGNTSGPHCHIEVINLGSMSVSEAVSRFQSTADFSWGNGWGSSAVNNNCSVKAAPCRIRPETIF
ncbi:murein hydrolase activator EnvC family protein [Amedibacillus dolichus]|uniref:Peptidase, M23 family n=1 Tax=Amedibacillus dolichus DSM 3991 TaxID=428127 RepID=A8R994_9FIRM|nr:peptidoglycan DD-metalloendopeptidase family protein [Amedibacillus dolichus]EDP11954.1 peptidase, M23 family [Amedibacillus dolichus DSM 3991]